MLSGAREVLSGAREVLSGAREVSLGGGGEDCGGGGETPGVKVLVREGFVDSFVAIAGRISGDWVEPWSVTVLVWESIVDSALDVVGIGSWFNALGCSGTGRRGLGVTPTSCWDISGAGEGM